MSNVYFIFVADYFGSGDFQNRSFKIEAMNPRVASVEALDDYFLAVTFNNGEVRLFDVKPYLSRGIFSRLTDGFLFRQVRPFNGSVLWPGN